MKGKLRHLLNTLGKWTDPYAIETPDFYADAFRSAAEIVRGDGLGTNAYKHAATAFAQVTLYAEQHEPKDAALALRLAVLPRDP